jgi:hypothetical protein
MKNADEPINVIENRRASDGFSHYSIGLTKREYFAGLALQGLIARPNTKGTPTEYGNTAVIHADSLLKELDK